MAIGYILALIFAAIWLGFKFYESYKSEKAKQEALKNSPANAEVVDADIDDIIL